MASPAQFAANRANARLSTGPRTAAGKARSRLNAVTHGAYARVLVLAREDRAAFEALHAGFIEAFEPVGRYERALVERLSLIWWKMQRAVEAETIVLEATGYDDGRLSLDAKTYIRQLDRIGALEHRLQQAFERFHAILERRQGLRRRRRPRPAAPPSSSCASVAGDGPAKSPEHWLRFVRKTWNRVKSTVYTNPVVAAARRFLALRGPPDARFGLGPADSLFRWAKTGGVLFAMGRQGVKLAAE